MSKIKVGDAMGYCGSEGGRGHYVKMGVVFSEVVNAGVERLSIKIDAIPLPQSGWNGWVNIWTEATKPTKRAAPDPDPFNGDDDIPF